MNLYIRTQRSNLDNILSSESISPYSFYQGRAFGYRRFDRLKDDIYDNVLRVDTEIYYDPDDILYIELYDEDEQIRRLAPKGIPDSFYVAKTIHLYPWNCRILFKTVEDARNSIFLCRSSLTNKMWGYYKVGLVGMTETKSLAELRPNCGTIQTREEIEVDNMSNRVKGFLYGYYSGLCKSLPPELAKMLQAEMRLYGLATAVAGMRNPSKETINDIDQLKKIFNANDPYQARLKRLWNDNVIGCFSTPFDGELFERLLGRFGVQKTAMYAFAVEQGIAVSPRIDSARMTSSDWRVYAQQIDEYTRRVIDSSVNEKIVTEEERVHVKDDTVQLQKMKGTLYEEVVNEIVRGKAWLSVEQVGSNRLEVANELTYRLKEYDERHGMAWEGSMHQSYMERMRQNIAYSTPFDPNQTEDKGLMALVVYVLKGDMMDELIKYVQYAGIGDYSLVFGLWGANVGYANLPKTFVSRIGLTQQMISECYMEVCRTLTDVTASPLLNASQYLKDVELLEAISVTPTRTKLSDEREMNGDGLAETLGKLRCKPVRLTDSQLMEIRSVIEKNGWIINEQGFEQISKIKGVGKKKLNQIREVLKPWLVEENDYSLFKEPLEETPKFSAGITKYEIMQVIEDCLPKDEAVRSQVEKDISWYLRAEQGVISPNNIPKLCQYLKRNKEGYGRRGFWVRKWYTDVDVSKIERLLIETYL